MDPLRVIDWRMACFVGGIVEDESRRVEYEAKLQRVCHRRVRDRKRVGPREQRSFTCECVHHITYHNVQHGMQRPGSKLENKRRTKCARFSVCHCTGEKKSLVMVWHMARGLTRSTDARAPGPIQVQLHPLLLSSSMQTHITHHTPELPLLQGASQVLQDYFAKDSQVIPDIGELLVLRRSVQPHTQ